MSTRSRTPKLSCPKTLRMASSVVLMKAREITIENAILGCWILSLFFRNRFNFILVKTESIRVLSLTVFIMLREVKRATQQALAQVPQDLHPLLMEFVGTTRHDWRTCKQQEARIIEQYNAWIHQLAREILARRSRPPIPNLWLSKLWVCVSHLWHYRFWTGAALLIRWAIT